MRILQICALVSVCVIAAVALALVAMGYTVRLEAPQSVAATLPTGIVALFDPDHSNPFLLMEDGLSYWAQRAPDGSGGTVFHAGDASLPIPTSDVSWWAQNRLISADGMFWQQVNGEWFATPLPTVAVGASTGSTSGVKGRY